MFVGNTKKRTDVWSRHSCFYTQNFSTKKTWFFPHKIYFKKIFWLFFTFILCNFSVQTLKYFFKNWTDFLSIKTFLYVPEKLLIIGPDPFISQSSPDHSLQPRIDFSYYEISGPDICSLICANAIDSTKINSIYFDIKGLENGYHS